MSIDKQLLDETIRIATDAGEAIMAIYSREFSVTEKEDKSPLTEADAAAHDLIASRLKGLTPDIPILSEEDVEGFAGADSSERYWLVDPLDGTKEFIKRNGEFTVNIALVQGDGPILGVVYAPALDVLYFAGVGHGAWRQGPGDKPEPIEVAAHPSGDWRVVGSRSHAGGGMAAWLEQLGPHQMVPMGSSLKLCLVAEGKADVYPRLGPTSLWDTGAAQAVVEQAGGRVITCSGERLRYDRPEEVLNPYFIVHGNSDRSWSEIGC